MLKHVHFSSSSLVPYRCKTPTRDNVSLSSVLRFGSSLGPELTSSWSSSTSSLQEMSFPPEPPKGYKDCPVESSLVLLSDTYLHPLSS
ncbi:uncharacterized protein LOC143249962 isoform X2 [Tachypleus tridentatus]|uniref:uncharacterized protein LOC143249962 isoform X2 n=1 Tax=Tachypleus tridentatus TaxID=6853 RepID=UPI003FD6A688